MKAGSEPYLVSEVTVELGTQDSDHKPQESPGFPQCRGHVQLDWGRLSRNGPIALSAGSRFREYLVWVLVLRSWSDVGQEELATGAGHTLTLQ